MQNKYTSCEGSANVFVNDVDSIVDLELDDIQGDFLLYVRMSEVHSATRAAGGGIGFDGGEYIRFAFTDTSFRSGQMSAVSAPP